MATTCAPALIWLFDHNLFGPILAYLTEKQHQQTYLLTCGRLDNMYLLVSFVDRKYTLWLFIGFVLHFVWLYSRKIYISYIFWSVVLFGHRLSGAGRYCAGSGEGGGNSGTLSSSWKENILPQFFSTNIFLFLFLSCSSCQSCRHLVTTVKAVDNLGLLSKLKTACNNYQSCRQLGIAAKAVDNCNGCQSYQEPVPAVSELTACTSFQTCPQLVTVVRAIDTQTYNKVNYAQNFDKNVL